MTTAKLPLLKQGEYDMWKLRIEQYFQVQDYALWDVTENGNSFKPTTQTTTNIDSSSTTLIPGPVTVDENTQKKNDVKARSMLLMALLNEHLLTFTQYKDTKTSFAAMQTKFGGFRRFHASTQVSTASTQVSTANLSDDTVYAFLASQPNGSQLVYEDLEQIHEDDIEEMDLKWNPRWSVLTTTRWDTLQGNAEDLGTNIAGTGIKTALEGLIEFNKSEFNLATYKRGLASMEEKLVFYKKNEVIFYEQLAVLKRDISYKDSELSMLKSELEKLKQEKESNQLKIEKFDNAFKSLDKLIRIQITDKSRKGVGFVSYNVVPPPPTGLFSPLKFDLSNSGLEEFQQPKFEGYAPKTSKSISEDISNEVRESPDALFVEELVSDDKLEKKTIFPIIAKIELGHPQKEDQGYVDSGCSRHMTGNMSYLSDFKEFDGGYVTFGGGEPKEGKLLVKEHLKLSINMKNIVPKESLTCLVANAILDESMLWHMRLGHINFKTINKLVKENLVRGLPTKRFENDQTCVACLKGKQHRAFSTKDETSGILKSFITEVENLVDKKVKIIRCDNGTKFKNRVMSEFCEKKGIKKEFSVAKTPQQNGVAERRNRTLIKAASYMLADSMLPTTFWAKAVNTACYVQNRVLVVKPHNKTPYELFRGRTPALSFIIPFGFHVTILNTLDYLGKFDGKFDEGFFVGYSMNSKAFRVYNIRTRKLEENLHIRFLEDKPIIAGDGPKWLFDIDVLTKSMNYVPVIAGTNSNNLVGTEESIGAGHSNKETGSSQDYIFMPLWKDGSLFDYSLKNANNDEPQPSSDAGMKDDEGVNNESGIDDQERLKNITTAPLKATHANFFGDETKVDMSNITTIYPVPSTPNTRIHKDHSLDHVIGDVQFVVRTRRYDKDYNGNKGLLSRWIEAMQEELLQFKLQQVWTLVDLPHGKRAVGTKWVYRNKKDERGIVIRNKARLVAQGYTQEEGIVYDERAFLHGKIKEEVYVCQPPGFDDPEFPDRVYKVEKALYGLHQAPRAWYKTFSTYLLDNGFQRGQIDKTLFIKRVKSDILLVQVYIDDIIFGSTKKELCTEFEKSMHKKFQISSMASTPMETSKPLMKDEHAEDVDVHLYRSMIGSLMYLTFSRPDIMFDDSPFDLEAYTDSDYAGVSLDRKSTTGGCQFLRSRLISWQCKKQNIVANSTTEAEYVAAASCCG
ncbi:putative ribonuclease H-like domain-containing protein [Tanacetum coccineum]|uniref:Ribonuclease H-like domain-containing protein n=1 Tax=Tanacetum coccineum TaxID=301880 RepID=A0ABQ4Z2B8_9ASTR